MDLLNALRDADPLRSTVRIAVSGLARAGKTSFLTSAAANLVAGTIPANAGWRVAEAPARASGMPRFGIREHLAALARDPPQWPDRTEAVSLLALDVSVSRRRPLPERRMRLELLDYPGEWLLDLALLNVSFADWSADTLRRLEDLPPAQPFLDFVRTIKSGADADERLALAGHALYRDLLRRLREEEKLSMLQPGRFLLPAAKAEPPWCVFFPFDRAGPFGRLLAARYQAYVKAVRQDLAGPGFAQIDRLIVLADVLTPLHAGQAAFEDARLALGTVAAALRWRVPPRFVPGRVAALLPLGGIDRVAFVASKADHVAEQQRGNLAELVAAMVQTDESIRSRTFAVAAVSCTEDIVRTLDGRPVSAVRGYVPGQGLVGSYPGEVPRGLPGAAFWSHPFLQIPPFAPKRLSGELGGAVPNIGLQRLFEFILEDVL